jgi:hypothetical protein
MDQQKLRNLYESNKVAQIFFDHMTKRQRNQGETKVHRILQLLGNNGNEVSRNQIVDLFKNLEQIGCGRFVPGRWGWSSRFVWEVGSKSASLAAAGESEEIEMIQEDSNGNPEYSDILKHTFNLRSDFKVEFDLPVDLTSDEADRLAGFVKTLPMEEYD